MPLDSRVPAHARFVAPCTGVVDNDRVVDAVALVVDPVRTVGVQHPDDVAVGDEAIVLFIDPQCPQESPMHRVAPQQGRALAQVVRGLLAHDDGLQPQLMAAADLLDQQASQQTADAAEAEQHDILGFLERWHVPADHLRAFAPDEFHRLDATVFGFVHETGCQLAHIDMRRPQVELRERFADGIALELRQFVMGHLPHIAVRLHDLDDALVVQCPAVTVGHHVVAIQAPDDGNHRLGQGFALFPIGKIVIETR